MNGHKDGQIEGWMGGHKDGQIEGQICTYKCNYNCTRNYVVIVIARRVLSFEEKFFRSVSDLTKTTIDYIGFQAITERGKQGTRTSCRRLLGNLFQKSGLTKLNLLYCTVDVRVGMATREPCATERRELWSEM